MPSTRIGFLIAECLEQYFANNRSCLDSSDAMDITKQVGAKVASLAMWGATTLWSQATDTPTTTHSFEIKVGGKAGLERAIQYAIRLLGLNDTAQDTLKAALLSTVPTETRNQKVRKALGLSPEQPIDPTPQAQARIYLSIKNFLTQHTQDLADNAKSTLVQSLLDVLKKYFCPEETKAMRGQLLSRHVKEIPPSLEGPGLAQYRDIYIGIVLAEKKLNKPTQMYSFHQPQSAEVMAADGRPIGVVDVTPDDDYSERYSNRI